MPDQTVTALFHAAQKDIHHATRKMVRAAQGRRLHAASETCGPARRSPHPSGDIRASVRHEAAPVRPAPAVGVAIPLEDARRSTGSPRPSAGPATPGWAAGGEDRGPPEMSGRATIHPIPGAGWVLGHPVAGGGSAGLSAASDPARFPRRMAGDSRAAPMPRVSTHPGFPAGIRVSGRARRQVAALRVPGQRGRVTGWRMPGAADVVTGLTQIGVAMGAGPNRRDAPAPQAGGRMPTTVPARPVHHEAHR